MIRESADIRFHPSSTPRSASRKLTPSEIKASSPTKTSVSMSNASLNLTQYRPGLQTRRSHTKVRCHASQAILRSSVVTLSYLKSFVHHSRSLPCPHHAIPIPPRSRVHAGVRDRHARPSPQQLPRPLPQNLQLVRSATPTHPSPSSNTN